MARARAGGRKPARVPSPHSARPTTGVFLMVAVTVAFGAIVFWLAQDLMREPEAPPRMVTRWDGDGEALVVQQPPVATPWSDVEVTCSDGSPPLLLDRQGEPIQDAQRPIQAGDAVTGCGPGSWMTLRHPDSGQVLAQDVVPGE